MDTSDVRQMLRRLARRPGLTAAAIATLALALGATVAMFTVVYGVLVKPLPYPEADRLVGLWHRAPKMGLDKFNQSYGSYTLYRERGQTIEEAGLYDIRAFNVAGAAAPERVIGARATASVFTVLGVEPIIGRSFSRDEDQPGGPDVLILGHGIWQRRFGGDVEAIGAVLQVDGEPREVIGVMPPGFAFPQDDIEMWVPHPIDAEELSEVNFSYDVVARMAPGMTVEQVSREVDGLLRELPEAYPGAMSAGMLEQSGAMAFANALRDDQVGDVSQVLWVLLAAVGFVLLIACANVANLQLVRTEGRHKELAVRLAMGASRGRLTRHLLLESVFLALVGGALGLVLAGWSVRTLARLDPGNLPRLAEIRIDGTVLGFAVLLSLIAGLAFGLLPSARLRGRVLGDAMAEGGRGGMAGRSSQRLRGMLVVAQVAFAVVLLFGSALMLRTFQALREVDPGFDQESVLTLRVNLHGDRYAEPEGRARFWTRLVDETRDQPGVAQAATVLNLPLTDGDTNPAYIIEDFPPQPDDPPLVARQNFVTDGYFETMGIPMLAGRGLTRADVDKRAPSVVVSQAFARRIWGEVNAVGKRLTRGLPTEQGGPWYEVVGVAGDVRDDDLTAAPVEMVYFPVHQQDGDESGWTPGVMSLAVRASGGDPRGLTASLREVLQRLDPDLPVIGVRTTAEITSGAMARTTFAMVLLVIASGVALLLGSIGIYGVLAYAVVLRTREIGVRMALGAAPSRMLGMLVGQGMRLVAVGVVAGVAGAFATGRGLSTLLYGITPTDVPSLAAVVVALVIVATLASLVPARRASRIAPTEALRSD